jgi:ATP-dependent RNA helicase DOB1
MEPIFTGTPAKEYPFELDPFQKTSVACLVRGFQYAVAGHVHLHTPRFVYYLVAVHTAWAGRQLPV